MAIDLEALTGGILLMQITLERYLSQQEGEGLGVVLDHGQTLQRSLGPVRWQWQRQGQWWPPRITRVCLKPKPEAPSINTTSFAPGLPPRFGPHCCVRTTLGVVGQKTQAAFR